MTTIQRIKQIRQDGDKLIQQLKSLSEEHLDASLYTNEFGELQPYSNEFMSAAYQAQIKITEGVMWCGMMLKALNEANPYPSSKDPNTGNIIEPTADNLKL